jgi:origin recognition complex subunit 1
MTRINFQPYTTQQLGEIVQTRLNSVKESLQGADSSPQDVISADGIKFAAMKVSSISGDARRVLDICRRAVELVQPLKKTAKTEDVKEVIKVMQNSPTAAYIRDCSLHERMMLAATLKCIRRDGVEEVKWGDVSASSSLTGEAWLIELYPSGPVSTFDIRLHFDLRLRAIAKTHAL